MHYSSSLSSEGLQWRFSRTFQKKCRNKQQQKINNSKIMLLLFEYNLHHLLLFEVLIEKGLGGRFSITKMLRMKKKMHVDSNNCKQVYEVFKEISLRNGSLTELSHGFLFNGIHFEQLYHLLDIRKSLGHLDELTVETVCLPKKEILSFERIFLQKQIKDIPIGYELKNLELIIEYSEYGVQALYKILAKCRNLESCQIQVDENSKKTTHLYSDDTFDENYIHVPLMNNLKHLDVDSFEEDPQFMFDLLKFCPNLETLHYACEATPKDEFLKFVSEMCPKLRRMTIQSEYSRITDDALVDFLTRQKEMEYLDIRPTPMISGKVFKHLDQFEKLKYLRIRRCLHYASIAPQLVDDFQLGSRPLPNLHYLDIGNNYRFSTHVKFDRFENSLKLVAPNLKDFYEMDKTSILELYVTTLETTIGTLTNLSELHLCTNLKRVVLQIPENSKFDGIPVCPHVIELEFHFNYYLDSTVLLQLARIFPSVEVLDISFCGDSFVELLKNSSFWPKLVYLKVSPTRKEKLINIDNARPSIYIEGFQFPIIPNTFNYLWLERDLNVRNEYFLT